MVFPHSGFTSRIGGHGFLRARNDVAIKRWRPSICQLNYGHFVYLHQFLTAFSADVDNAQRRRGRRRNIHDIPRSHMQYNIQQLLLRPRIFNILFTYMAIFSRINMIYSCLVSKPFRRISKFHARAVAK
jgi:hypothetical protein